MFFLFIILFLLSRCFKKISFVYSLVTEYKYILTSWCPLPYLSSQILSYSLHMILNMSNCAEVMGENSVPSFFFFHHLYFAVGSLKIRTLFLPSQNSFFLSLSLTLFISLSQIFTFSSLFHSFSLSLSSSINLLLSFLHRPFFL